MLEDFRGLGSLSGPGNSNGQQRVFELLMVKTTNEGLGIFHEVEVSEENAEQLNYVKTLRDSSGTVLSNTLNYGDGERFHLPD